ncbi:RET2 [Candida theae]|uniref:Coatomer subunit delta n=1 Tax=Candida theae TaxID=1198502 RepID=A0AAD5BC18_9ASCO|nr:RET2 [Candida theae]KAI5950681.1 RET2 [Candida theae]
MVVLAASICTRGGKPLLSRQFRDISKDRITALLANFPSLISNSASQHTTVEDENVRYVYQPLEEFYIVLISNKTSNILQDIDTLHLFASAVSNLLRNVDEREIFDSAFDIIDAFDEIINMGYKENLTISQVQTFLEMHSHEEKIQEIIERNKEFEAAEERKRRAKEIQRRELANRNNDDFGQRFGGGGAGGGAYSSLSQPTVQQPVYQPPLPIETEKETKSTFSSRPRGGGLQLGKKTNRPLAPANEPLLSNQQPAFARPSQSSSSSSTPAQYQQSPAPPSKTVSPAPQAPKVPNNGILITVNEKVNARLSREGSVLSSEVKGDLQLRINDQSLANAKILLKISDKADKKQYKTHPNVDRNLFQNESILTVKDKSKTFPSNDQALGVLRWRYVGKQDDLTSIPILITAWVNIDDNAIAQVTLEYELPADFTSSHPNDAFKVENVKVLIPIVSHDVVLQEGNDAISYDILDQTGIVFNIGSITLDDPQGSFEFAVPVEGGDEESLFPLEVQFDINNVDLVESDVSLGGVSVTDVVSNDDDENSLPFDLHANIISESYIIE